MSDIKGFNIHIEADVFLKLEEIWPDGDAPETPTADDVRDLILSLYRDRADFLREWSLLDDLGVDVDSVAVWK